MAFFENFHNAAPDFPYIDCQMQNINYFPHIHEEIEIVYVLTGSTDITCENSCFTASKGDICIFMPGEIHSFSSPDPNRLYIIKLQYKNSMEQTDFSTLRMEHNLLNKSSKLRDLLTKLILQLAEETQTKRSGYGYMANSISQQILCGLIRSGQLIKIPAETKKKRLFYVTLLEKVNTYIADHYTEPVSLTVIAAHCHLSEYYFSHVFKEATKSTFYNYLTAYRLDKAATLLLYSDKKITDIALECGFSNTRAFNRAFKNFFHKTPTEYTTTASAK